MKIKVEAEAYEILTVLSCLKPSLDDASEETAEKGKPAESTNPDAEDSNGGAPEDDDPDELIEVITARHMTLKTMERMALAGELEVGDQLLTFIDGNPAAWDVIGINVDEPEDQSIEGRVLVTVQMHDLLPEELPFNEDGTNKWEDSTLREYLNGAEFASRLEPEFRGQLLKVCKDNDGRDDTTDTFFLLSKDEYDPMKTQYLYYRNERNRVKFTSDGTTDWHLTRSAYRGYANYVWIVSPAGYVDNGTASYAYRCAPACVLIF